MHQSIVRPGTLLAIDVEARAVADLRDDPAEVTQCPWRDLYWSGREPPSWTLAAELLAAGAEGALVPSVQNPGGTNLVLWRWHDAAVGGVGVALSLLDPEGALG